MSFLILFFLLLLFLFLLGRPLQKMSKLRRFKLDRDEIWQDCSSSKYASTLRIGFLMTSYFQDGGYDVRPRSLLYRPPAAASPPSACDVIGSLYVLQFLVYNTTCSVSRV